MHTDRARVAGTVLVLCIAMGCGYRAGFVARDDIRTVSVPVFANDTFYRHIETDLTGAVIDEIGKVTPYRIARSNAADAVLEGRIVQYRTALLVEDAADEVIESEILLSVEVTLRDGATGSILAQALIRESESFSPALGEEELAGRPALFRRVARLVVERTFEETW